MRYGHLLSEHAAELETRDQEIDAKALAAHAAAGARPAAKLGKGRTTWSGLSTHQLADRFKLPGWYDLFYSPFSDTAHVNAAAIDKELSQLVEGKVHLGGRFESPEPPKWQAARRLAAALSVVGLATMDRVQLGELSGDRLTPMCGRNRMSRIWTFLEGLEPAGETGPRRAAAPHVHSP